MRITIWLFLIVAVGQVLFAQEDSRTVDRIVIDGTWMTRDIVVLGNLDFRQGDTINQQDLDRAEKNLYDLGLFSRVEFSWVIEDNGSTTLRVLAKDQLHIMPLVVLEGASNTIKLGAVDGNFLGLNVDLRLAYKQEKEYAAYEFIKRRIGISFSLPDTMLNGFSFTQKAEIGISGNAEHTVETELSLPTDWFGGWEWAFEFTKSLEVNYLSTDGVKDSGYSLDSWYVGTVLYPELDFDLYPMFSLGWESQEIGDLGVMDTGFVGGAGLKSFVDVGIGITYGDIRTKNSYFQKNGWEILGEYNAGIKTTGDSSVENLFHKLNLGAEGHWLAFNWLELAGYLDYAVTDSDMVSNLYNIRIHSTRDRAVPGLQIQGKTYYSITAHAHITYINTDWFALEHVSWLDTAQGGTALAELFSVMPKIAIGTGLRFRVPNIPWFYVYFDVQWARPVTGQKLWGLKI